MPADESDSANAGQSREFNLSRCRLAQTDAKSNDDAASFGQPGKVTLYSSSIIAVSYRLFCPASILHFASSHFVIQTYKGRTNLGAVVFQ